MLIGAPARARFHGVVTSLARNHTPDRSAALRKSQQLDDNNAGTPARARGLIEDC